MPYRLQLTVAYDGAPLCAVGKARRTDNTIQDHFEKALRRDCRERNVRVAWRAGAPMPAFTPWRSVLTSISSSKAIPAGNGWKRLTASLPPTIRVMARRYVFRPVSRAFLSRRKDLPLPHLEWNGFLPPFEVSRAWHVHARARLRCHARRERTSSSAPMILPGSPRIAGKPEQSQSHDRRASGFADAGRCLTIEFSGDGFLYKMVRLMVGALVRCGSGQAVPARSRNACSFRIASRRRAQARRPGGRTLPGPGAVTEPVVPKAPRPPLAGDLLSGIYNDPDGSWTPPATPASARGFSPSSAGVWPGFLASNIST